MKKDEPQEKLTDFVPFPRAVYRDLREGRITTNEYELYMRLRHGANPYGILDTSIEDLVADFKPKKWKKNYINKLLISLKGKRYLHYRKRAGRSGLFSLRLPEFSLPGGKVTTWESIVVAAERILSTQQKEPSQSEDSQRSMTASQRSDMIKLGNQRILEQMTLKDVRGSYTDTETYNKK